MCLNPNAITLRTAMPLGWWVGCANLKPKPDSCTWDDGPSNGLAAVDPSASVSPPWSADRRF